MQKGDPNGSPSCSVERGRAPRQFAAPAISLQPLVTAAVAVPTLETHALLETVDLAPQHAELAAADAVAAGPLQLTLDLVGLAAKAESLALRDDAALRRPLD